MPLLFSCADLANVVCEAIVVPANSHLRGGNALFRRVCEAAGEEPARTLENIAPLDYGQAAIAPGGDLPCRFLIVAVPPRWYHGLKHEEELLASCYTRALTLARENGCQSVALPLLSPQTFYGIPHERERALALDAMRPFYEDAGMTVVLITERTEMDRCKNEYKKR